MIAAVEVHDLTKSYAGRQVLAGIDLTIAAGECVALLGPNGAGKTTTIEILEGFRVRDGGQVAVLGTDPARAGRDWRARVGVVGQDTGAALALTVAETVRHFAHYHAYPRPTDDLLAAVGLTEQAGLRVAALSGGQRRRLDVALGVQGRPDLLFLDEPTTGLDPGARRQFWQLIRGLRADGTTILLTTHYLDEAAQLADRVVVIAGGRLLENAPPDRIGATLRLATTVGWTDEDGARLVVTRTPTAVLRDLLARYPSGELPGLSVHRPTIEEAYLALLAAAEDDAPAPRPEAVRA
jgi:ABC-2 type transport system ATP-binding protein